MTPGYRSCKTGMCLQRSWIHNPILGYHAVEKLDSNTKYLVRNEGQEENANFHKVDIETCESFFLFLKFHNP